MAITRHRWGDNDSYWGPFTYARDGRGYRPFAVVLSSERYVRLSGFGHTLIIATPRIIRSYRYWVDTSKYTWSNNPAGGYWSVDKREFGFSYSDGFLQIHRGRCTMDSSTDRTKGYFLPWTQWRHVRESFYGQVGEHIATIPDTGKSYAKDPGRWERKRAVEDAVPTVSFSFDDFDSERIVAETKISEREWRFGTGWFKWLSLFRRPKIRRSLSIKFSSETGERKGSWKGGTVGSGIDMLPGELHEQAFRRYCAENKMTFVERLMAP